MLDSALLWYFAAGFGAQLVDSSLGMAFGTLSSSSLLALGFPAQSLSATVHTAEIFTSAMSSYSHWRLRNIDFALLRRLAPFAVLGALLGSLAILLMPGDNLRPLLAVYFVMIGSVIAFKALWPAAVRPLRQISARAVGGLGGFFDAFTGAGWGEIVSSGLILRGDNVQKSVGTLNSTEFLVTTTVTLVFITASSATHWPTVVALALGGMCAAPIGAWACKHLPARPLTFAVGVVVALLGLRTLGLALV
ncbi:MAG: sulfite exporter TauE/SafE family protein [Pseudomonadota bacterium]